MPPRGRVLIMLHWCLGLVSVLCVSAAMSSYKTCVVTGGNQGIGYHLALQMGRKGYKVVIGCRRPDAGTQAVTELQKAGLTSVECIELDISKPDSVSNFATSFASKYPAGCDVLFNNAAIAFKAADPTPFYGQSEPTVSTNVFGTIDVTNKLLPHLKKAGGRVVTVASRSGLLRTLKTQELKDMFVNAQEVKQLTDVARDFIKDAQENGEANAFSSSNYGMSKCLVIAYTRVMQKLEPDIGWSSFCPGFCNTSMTSGKGPRPPSEGAETGVWLATTPDESIFKSGGFFAENTPCSWDHSVLSMSVAYLWHGFKKYIGWI